MHTNALVSGCVNVKHLPTHSWYGVRWQQRRPYMTWELPSTQTVSEETHRKKVALYGWELKIKSPTAEAHLLSKTKSPSYLDSGYLDLCSQAQSPLLGNEFEYWYKQACLYLLPCCREWEKRKRMQDTYCLMPPGRTHLTHGHMPELWRCFHNFFNNLCIITANSCGHC